MKIKLVVTFVLIYNFCSAQKLLVKDSLTPINTELTGYIGEKIDLCIKNRIQKQDVKELTNVFKQRKETELYQTEFWGKWALSAIAAYEYRPIPALKTLIDKSVKDMLATQTADGYIGNYAENAHLKGWDVWGRKYTLLALLAYYDLTKDKNILTASKKLADHLLTEVGPTKANIVKTGSFKGMPSSSILEPIIYLYNRTGEQKYLDFAKYIVKQWETPEGPMLVSKALSGVNVGDRFPPLTEWWSNEKGWWSRENGLKAYEMMSCYDGLLELYKITGEPEYLKAVEMTAQNIMDTEINIAGSGASFECWYHGKERQSHAAYNMMETCVSQTWMKLCNKLLLQTGNPLYADYIESLTYNALLASAVPDMSSFAKYSPLESHKSLAEGQCNMNINCCTANGPRAFLLLPKFAVMSNKDGIYINLYSPSKTQLFRGKNKIQLEQITSYPKTDSVVFLISPDKPEVFTLGLRIPTWSKKSEIYVNGKKIERIAEGSYYKLRESWKKGDKVVLRLDMRGRIHESGIHRAIVRGPIVLARDTRFNDGDIDEIAEPQTKAGYIDLIENPNHNSKMWMSFSAPFVVGVHQEGNKPVQILFTDYASAGNEWDKNSRFRVWLPNPLNPMYMPYKK